MTAQTRRGWLRSGFAVGAGMNESVPAASRRHGNEVTVCVSPAQDLNHDARLPWWCADDHGGNCRGKARARPDRAAQIPPCARPTGSTLGGVSGEREQNWYPIGKVGWFTQHIREGIEVTAGQLGLLQPALAQPCRLDDATVARIIRVH